MNMTEKELTLRSTPTEALPDDVADRIAKEIGKMVAAHIQNMYPEAAEAVAWKSASLSIEGVVRNAVKSAGREAENGTIDDWLYRTRKERIRNNKMWRDIRAMKTDH